MREKSLRVIVPTFFMAFFMVACGTDDGSQGPVPVSTSEQTSVNPQGMWLQGMWLQGMWLQGTSLVGIEFQGAQVGAAAVQDLALQGTALTGQIVNGDGAQALTGADFVGATLAGVDVNGHTVQFRIDAVQADPGDASGQTLLYTLSAYNPASGTWQNACQPDPTGGQFAIPVAGVWASDGSHSDSAQYFTFGCTSGVIAKCVRWGYKPWETYAGQSLASYHQACTRMARADYCGDGTTHTMNGTLIDVYDGLGIQVQSPHDGMLFEAAWTPSGAYCISKARWNLIAAGVLLECPQKITLPDLGDILNRDSCVVKLSPGNRSSALMSDRSYIQVSLQLRL